MPVCWAAVFMFVFTLLTLFLIKMGTTLNWLEFSLSVEITVDVRKDFQNYQFYSYRTFLWLLQALTTAWSL